MPAKDRKAERKATYDRRREREIELHRVWYRTNREAILVRQRAYYAANREAEVARVKAWQEANPLAHRMNLKVQGANKRAKRLGIAERITRDDVMAVFDEARWDCAVCGSRLDLSGNLDHVTPMALGGRNHRSNLQCLCESPCHDAKTSRDRHAMKVAVTSVTEND
jgi:5-methylcytosine-specific restriction endonuclease McrA